MDNLLANLIITNLSLVLFFLITILFILFIFRTRYLKSKRDSRELQIIQSLQERNKAFMATSALNELILQTLDFNVLTQRIANAIPQFLGYETGVLAIVDEQKGVLKRVAISETSGGAAALKTLEIPFRNIEIKLTENQNYCIKALKEGKLLSTTSLYDVLRPVVSEKNSQWVQAQMDTKTTLIYPIYSLNKKPLGTFLVSMNKSEDKISDYERQTISNFVDGVRIALMNSTLFTSLQDTTTQLQEANKKLQELDKLKDDFVSVASHELRTPMTAIRSYVWMALNRPDIPLSEKMKKYLSRTLISTERLINLVNDMLNVSRIESGRVEIKPAVFDIGVLAEDVMTEVGPKASEKIIHLQVKKDMVPKVFADQDKVHQVLLNLIGNSLKFTPNDGLISVSFFTDGQVVEISVKDNGVGISKDDLGRLFKKFGRLDNSYVAAATSGGTGLGLYIARSLVELSGGKIWATSPGLGKGTTFSFSLPIASPATLAQAEKFTRKVEGEAKVLEPVAI